MRPDICPCITAVTQEQFNKQIEKVADFAIRIHIDTADGILAPNKLVEIQNIWWPGGVRSDLHIMYQEPFVYTNVVIDLAPQLVIVHAEAKGDFVSFANQMHAHGIEVGVALMPNIPAHSIEPAIDLIDHVLIFSGKLGFFGGTANLGLLQKVAQLRSMKPQLEIGWDGGINADNIIKLRDGGVDVLNVGGYIQQSDQPMRTYNELTRLITRIGR